VHGVERGLNIQYSNCEVLIMGGRTRNGDTDVCIRYNFRDNSYIFGPMPT
jgi:hypothetical protein